MLLTSACFHWQRIANVELALGFGRILRLLEQRKLPLVGHYMLGDALYLTKIRDGE